MGCKRKERVNIYSNIQGLHSCGEKWNCHLLSYGRLEEEQPGSERAPGRGNGNPNSILAWEIPWLEEPSRLHP